jgi:hypothetical protein
MKISRRRVWSIAGFVLALAAAFAAGAWAQSQARVIWRWPDSMDAVAAAPKSHRVLVENDHIRLIEATVQPGETEEMHGHRWPSVFAVDSVQPRLTGHPLEGDPHTVDRRYEDADWYTPQCRTLGPQAPEQFTNTDNFPQHLYRLEFKKMDGKSIVSKTSY